MEVARKISALVVQHCQVHGHFHLRLANGEDGDEELAVEREQEVIRLFPIKKLLERLFCILRTLFK